MNYIAAITTLFQCSSHRLSERSKVLDVDFDFAVTSLPKYEQITELIESFPQRDIVTLSLINENDDLFYMSSQDLTVILANVVSDKPLDNIFTRDITLILEAVLLGSVVYLIICISETKYKVKKVQDSYDALKANYSSLLTSEDIAQAFGNDKLITKMVNEVNSGIIRYSLLWGLFILFSLVAIEIISTEPFVTPLLQHLFTIIKNILLQTTCN